MRRTLPELTLSFEVAAASLVRQSKLHLPVDPKRQWDVPKNDNTEDGCDFKITVDDHDITRMDPAALSKLRLASDSMFDVSVAYDIDGAGHIAEGRLNLRQPYRARFTLADLRAAVPRLREEENAVMAANVSPYVPQRATRCAYLADGIERVIKSLSVTGPGPG